MDNGQMPPIQMVPPVQPMVGGMPSVQSAPGGMPMVQQVQLMPTQKKDISGLVKTIVIVILSLVAVTFIGLFIWMFLQYSEVKEDVDGQISEAVANAKDEQFKEDNARFLETEKNPYRTFAGPVDYGQLTFNYPKTWSVYIEEAAVKGGDFRAYFNPIQVDAVGEETINALRVTISNVSFEDAADSYRWAVEAEDAQLSVKSVEIGDKEKGTETTANLYTGKIPGTELIGYIVIFKIRDKTVTLRTDSVLFEKDFFALLDTITFNA